MPRTDIRPKMGYHGKLPFAELEKPIKMDYGIHDNYASELKSRMQIIYQNVARNLEEA